MSPTMDPADLQNDNPNIPSGFTYLAQFVAHDVVATSIPFWAVDRFYAGVRNERSSRLMLDTLYGGGPILDPLPFGPDDSADTSRTKFRLGQMPGVAPISCPFRDIVRVGVTGTSANERKGLTEPLIADPRNDDNAILSQLTALFQSLHNTIVVLASANDPESAALGDRERHFLCAREATTLIFRTIVRNDLLPRILCKPVWQLYDATPSFLDQDFANDPSGPLPLEFSHGAFRFGHGMVRDHYQLNATDNFSAGQVINQTSTRNPRGMPLDSTWMVSWARFFQMRADIAPNLSHRIGPTLQPALQDNTIFPEIDDTGWFGLAYRDLMSASLARLWTVDELVGMIRGQRPQLIDASPLLANGAWRDKLTTWLVQGRKQSGLDAADIASIVSDPPLPFFVLFEAEQETKGLSLGTLGSIIVADVLYAILAQGPLAVTHCSSLSTLISDLSTRTYGDTRLAPLGAIDTMAKMVALVSGSNNWRDYNP